MRILLRLGVIFWLGLSLVAPAAWASQDQTVTFEAPRDLLNGRTRAATFRALDSLGVRAIRVVLYWRDVAPDPTSRVRPGFDPDDPNAYDWSRYEPALAQARARGWSVLLTISGPVPLWASNGAVSPTYSPRPSQFEQFVNVVARRLGRYVTRYSIYNEPNHPKFLTPQFDARRNPVSPRLYRSLYAAAIRGLLAAGNTKPVLAGETSPRGTREGVAPLLFLRETLCLTDRYVARSGCEVLPIDGWATHPYTARSPFLRRIPRDDVTIGTLGRLTRALDRAAEAGVVAPRLPIHLTEFGMQSRPDPLGISLLRQAEYRAIAEQIAWSNPRVASFAQYLLRDDNPRRGPVADRYSGFETGLRAADGRDKPALAAFRLPLVVRRVGASASLWGLVRPGGRQTIVVEQRDGRGAWVALATVQTNAAGHWTLGASHRRGRTWRVSWRGPGGRTFTGPPTRAYR